MNQNCFEHQLLKEAKWISPKQNVHILKSLIFIRFFQSLLLKDWVEEDLEALRKMKRERELQDGVKIFFS